MTIGSCAQCRFYTAAGTPPPDRVDDLIAHRPCDSLHRLERIDGIGPTRVEQIRAQGLAAIEC